MEKYSKYKSFEEIERCVSRIFEESGFQILYGDLNLDKFDKCADIVVEKGDAKYCVEIKNTMYITDATLVNLQTNAVEMRCRPILVSTYLIDEEKRRYYEENYNKVIIVDISNLLYAVGNNEIVKSELISLLPYTVDNIVPRKGFLPNNSSQYNSKSSDKLKLLRHRLSSCEAGRDNARNFEIICAELLREIFGEDLTLWRDQPHSNNDLYRFDLLCRIKDDNHKTFWAIVEKYYNSKYIVFEFKNYTKPVTQKEIYTTEKYLYEKALRKVAIMISAGGYDDNSKWAAKGCLRENGKLILLLSVSDLTEMAKIKENQEDPSLYLLNLLDDLLLELEK